MIGIIIAVLLAALVYALCVALGLPSIVAIIAAILVLLAGIPSGGYGLGGRFGGRCRDLTQDSGTMAAVARDGRPGPVDRGRRLQAAFARFRKDLITDDAAALTYYALLSLFPALLFGVALLGFFGQEGLIGDVSAFLKDAGAPAVTVNAVVERARVRAGQPQHRADRARARPRRRRSTAPPGRSARRGERSTSSGAWRRAAASSSTSSRTSSGRSSASCSSRSPSC